MPNGSPDADALRACVAADGVSVAVEAVGTMATLGLESGDLALLTPDRRAAMVRHGRACGFTHVAVELRA